MQSFYRLKYWLDVFLFRSEKKATTRLTQWVIYSWVLKKLCENFFPTFTNLFWNEKSKWNQSIQGTIVIIVISFRLNDFLSMTAWVKYAEETIIITLYVYWTANTLPIFCVIAVYIVPVHWSWNIEYCRWWA